MERSGRRSRRRRPTARPTCRPTTATWSSGRSQKYLPRIGRSERTTSRSRANGWVRVDDELCSRDPKALRRLGRELSLALGAIVLTLGIEEGAVVRFILWDRGGIADEYASVPEHYGPLPPGDVVALGANPTVTQRLTGADPDRVRAVARTAATADELPPPERAARADGRRARGRLGGSVA